MMKYSTLLILPLFLIGCNHCKTCQDPTIASFHLEADSFLNEGSVESVQLPISGISSNIAREAVFNQNDIESVEIAQLDLGKCLKFNFKPEAKEKLTALAETPDKETLYLLVNKKPMGFRTLEGPLEDDSLCMFVETPEKNLVSLANTLNSSTNSLRKFGSKF